MRHPLDLTGLCKNRIENIVKSVSSNKRVSERAKDNWKVEWSRFDFHSSSSSSSPPSSHSPPSDQIYVRWTVYKNIIRLKNFLHLTILFFLLDVLHCLSIMSFSHFSLCYVFQFYFITWARRRRWKISWRVALLSGLIGFSHS